MNPWWDRAELRGSRLRPSGQRRAESEQLGAVVAHLSSLPVVGLGLVVVGRPLVWLLLTLPIGPLVVRTLASSARPWIHHHATEALNFAITISALVAVVGGGLSVVARTAATTFFVPLLLVLLLLTLANWLTLLVMGAIEAGRGVAFRYPAIIRLVPSRTV